MSEYGDVCGQLDLSGLRDLRWDGNMLWADMSGNSHLRQQSDLRCHRYLHRKCDLRRIQYVCVDRNVLRDQHLSRIRHLYRYYDLRWTYMFTH
jgi:hypothetical protein